MRTLCRVLRSFISHTGLSESPLPRAHEQQLDRVLNHEFFSVALTATRSNEEVPEGDAILVPIASFP